MNISVHIERLILDGLPIAQRDRAPLQASIEAELERLLTEGTLSIDLRAPGTTPRLTGGAIELIGDEEPPLLGKHIAQAIYGGIGA